MVAKRVTQAQLAYDLIKEKIFTREIVAGKPILEVELAEQFNMSRTPVHEAIRRLEKDGYLDVIARRGAFVKNLSIAELIKCYEVTEGLEGMVGYLLAEMVSNGKIDKREIRKLQKLVNDMTKYYEKNDITKWVETDTAFHAGLYELCENQFLIEHITRLKNQFNCVSMYITPLYVDKKKANEEHQLLLDCIKVGAPEKARDAAQNQRRSLRNKFERLLNEQVL